MFKVFIISILLSFQCFARSQWTSPVQIDQSEEFLFGDIALDGSGNAILAWCREDGLFVAYFDASLEMWNEPEILSEEPQLSIPTLAVNNQGCAVIAWSNKDFIRTSHFDPVSKSWSKATSISKKGNFLRPSISIDGYGNVIVVWNNRLAHKIESASYDPLSGYWSSPVTLANDVSKGFFYDEWYAYASSPAVQMTREGVGVAAWVVIKGDSCVVQGSFYDADTKKWGGLIDFTSKFASDVFEGEKTGTFFDLCLNEHGIATIVWGKPGYTYPSIEYVEYNVKTQKRQTRNSSQFAAVGIGPEIFTNENGQAVLTFAFRYKHVLIPFDTGDKIVLDDLTVFGDSFALEARTGIDQHGNILTAWCDYDKETMKQYVTRYDADLKRWERPVCLATCPFEGLGMPALCVQEDGHAALTWSTYDPEEEVYLLNLSFYNPDKNRR